MRFRLFVALFALIALGLETSAQTAYSSTEYYVVADYRAGSSTLPLLWDNFVLRDAQSQNTTIDFSVQVASGQIGALGGPVFVVGAYEMEPIWLTATALGGSLPGHAHFQANLGNTAPADRPHFNATPDQLKGWRFTRTDGQA
ncbi:MAG: hypothetical protein KDB53_13695, partial [Planctomycetes bacterium]|nr:hypothetical protein [Planctomycetota bacterium]